MDLTADTPPPFPFPELYSYKAESAVFWGILAVCGGCIAGAFSKSKPTVSHLAFLVSVPYFALTLGVGFVNFFIRLNWTVDIGKPAFPWTLKKRVIKAPQDFVTHVRGYYFPGRISPAPAVVLEHKPTGEKLAVLLGSRLSVRTLSSTGVQMISYRK